MRGAFLAAVLASGLGGPGRAQAAGGENCAACHAALRDRVGAPELAAGGPFDADVAVIGGGLSGLAAAHFLKGFSVVVLEKEAEAGGEARTESLAGGPAPDGAFDCGEPVGVVQSLLEDLGLKLAPLRDHAQRYLSEGLLLPLWWEPEGSARQPYPENVRGRLFRLAVDLEGLRSDYSLTVPVENSDVRVLKKYDRLTLWDALERSYGREVAAFGDLYSRFRFGAGAREVSAAAGLMYLSAELGPRYGVEGGLGRVSEALYERHKKEVVLEALVDGVKADREGVTVHYLKRGEGQTLRARAAILAVPAHVVRNVVQGLPADKARALAEVRTSAYVVVQLSLKKPLADAAVVWTPGRSFSAIVFPGPQAFAGPSPATGRSAAAYVPLGSGSGRSGLLSETDDQLRRQTLDELDQAFPGASALVEDARVVRWGHAVPLMGPGFLTSLQPRLERPEGRLFFSGVETEAPMFEGAVYSGFKAARQVRLFLRPESEPKEEPVDIPE